MKAELIDSRASSSSRSAKPPAVPETLTKCRSPLGPEGGAHLGLAGAADVDRVAAVGLDPLAPGAALVADPDLDRAHLAARSRRGRTRAVPRRAGVIQRAAAWPCPCPPADSAAVAPPPARRSAARQRALEVLGPLDVGVAATAPGRRPRRRARPRRARGGSDSRGALHLLVGTRGHRLCFSVCAPISSVKRSLHERAGSHKLAADASPLVLGGTLAWLLALGGSATAQGVQLVPFGGQDFDTPFHVTGAAGDPSRVFVVEAAGTIRLVKSGVTQATPFLDISADVLDINEGGLRVRAVLDGARPRLRLQRSLLRLLHARRRPRRSTTCGSRSSAARPRTRTSPIPPAAGSCSRSRTSTPPTTTAASSSSAPTACSTSGSATGDPSGNAQPLDRLVGKILRIDPAGAAPFQYSIPAGQPLRGRARRQRRRDLRLGRSQPLARLLRPLHRRPHLRRRRRGELGGDRLQARGHRASEPTSAGTASRGWRSPAAAPSPTTRPPVLEYPNGGAGAAVTGGFVIRDSALPSLAGRYIYADSQNALGGELRTVVLAPGRRQRRRPLGINVGGVVSFGQDACGHIYAAAISGPVRRLEPTSGPVPVQDRPGADGAGHQGRAPRRAQAGARGARRLRRGLHR